MFSTERLRLKFLTGFIIQRNRSYFNRYNVTDVVRVSFHFHIGMLLDIRSVVNTCMVEAILSTTIYGTSMCLESIKKSIEFAIAYAYIYIQLVDIDY